MSTSVNNIYLAISSPKFSGDHAQYFSPQMMQWSSDVWIFDISRCHEYWTLQADSAGLTIYEFFIKTLNHLCGSSNDYQAVLADHPWRAVLTLTHMKERQLNGLVDTKQGLGGLLVQQISWNAWWQSISELEHFMTLVRERRYRPATFRRQALQLRRAVERLNLKRPADLLLKATSSGIERRFGGLLKEIWQWAFQREHQDPLSMHQRTGHGGFPWIAFERKDLPQVQRHLDYGLREWEQIEPFLKEDLDRLCRNTEWTDREKVVCLEWRLTLNDMTAYPITILFRHPHCLHREMGHHRTTLLQAYYSFTSDRRTRRSLPSGKDMTAAGSAVGHTPGATVGTFHYEITDRVPDIVTWEIKLTQRLTVPAFMTDLFGQASTTMPNLLEIENRIAIPLEMYSLRSDWQPEDAYRRCGTEDVESHPLHASVLAAAKVRPLFIFPKPLSHHSNGQSNGWQFLERTMAKWWEARPQSDGGGAIQRDYYRMIDAERKSYWVYKNSFGQWYMHGIFA